jgi:hypothetical protein
MSNVSEIIFLHLQIPVKFQTDPLQEFGNLEMLPER